MTAPPLFPELRLRVAADHTRPDWCAVLAVSSDRWNRRAGACLPVPLDVLDDAGHITQPIVDTLRTTIQRHLEPWCFPDPPVIRWTFDPFPRITRITRRRRA